MSPGPYQIQAATNAVHSDASSAVDTDWSQEFALYDLLMRSANPVIELDRAAAWAEFDGADVALARAHVAAVAS